MEQKSKTITIEIIGQWWYWQIW